MNYSQEYDKWLNHPDLPQALRQELKSISGNETEIEDRFGQNLHFGTGGLRGVLGAGLNRMNIYTVRRASYALAQYLLKQNKDAAARGIAIGYDCRHMSPEFARETALAVAAVGMKAFVSPVLCPTPEVSFTVRHLAAAGGVMITASHNPPEYNGYKVYGSDGCQLLPDATTEIRKKMEEQSDVFEVPTMDLDEAKKRGLFQSIPPEVRTTYVNTVVDEIRFASVSDEDRKSLTLVYTPLHGAGNIPVRETLKTARYDKVTVVKEQEEPDGDFPTVKSPNPGDPASLKLGMRTAAQVHADIVLGTDPDSDRVGIAVRGRQGEYEHLTGNQVGALLMNFILSARKSEGRLPKNGIVFKTIVTSELGQAVADAYDIALENTLTGFKFIGSRITQYERSGQHTFLLGYEESYGYLISPMVRDKDAVQTSLAIAEMAAFYKNRGQSLIDALDELYERFGYYEEVESSVALDEGSAKTEIKSFMDGFRKEPLQITGMQLVAVEDYLSSTRLEMDDQGRPRKDGDSLQLPKSDVLKYLYQDGSWLAIRPSGTEPKIKTYLAARGTSKADCEAKVKEMQQTVSKRLTPPRS